MNTPLQPPPRPQFRVWHLVVGGLVLGMALAVIGVTGYFRLSSETAALRRSLMASVPGEWHTKIAVNVGYFTTGLVRWGSRLFKLPPEPRAAIDSLYAAEVGVYKLRDEPRTADQQAIFAAADRAMKWRGWERIVGVAKAGELVAIYCPRKGLSERRLRCCVLVWHGRDLVVGSARGNPAPLLAIAGKHFEAERNQGAGLLRACALQSH